MSGYSKSIFSQGLQSKFLCTPCSKVLRDPIQTHCGHRYCHRCLEEYIESSDRVTCEACNQEDNKETILSIQESNRDRAILRELNSCKVHCQNEGCTWNGLYKEYDTEHQSSCLFAIIGCIHSECGISLRRENLAEHLDNECLFRRIKCQFCSEEVTYKELKVHQSRCPKRPITCQYCREDVSGEKMTSHLDIETGDCPKKPVPCNFRDVGCNELIEKDKVKDHGKKFIGEHILMLLNSITPYLAIVRNMTENDGVIQQLKQTVAEQQTRIENLGSGTGKLEGMVNQIMEEMDGGVTLRNGMSEGNLKLTLDEYSKSLESLNHEQTVLKTKITTTEGVAAVLNNEIERKTEVIQQIKYERVKDRELIEGLERKVKAQDKIIAVKDVALAEQDLRIQSLEMASYDGVLLWKISDFERKRHDAISGKTLSLYSPCFYTSRHGYKMCARIYLNGDGMGKGNHVSVFFTIMKGPFDALLRWPFRQKVTLMWVDQNDREHVIDAFRPDPTSSSFKRPTQDMNIASGCPLFMPFSQLDSPRHGYVKDDVAFLKVIVDTSDLI
ncbi:TNF receptor-associated factor 2-like [Ptychodera flava]|uniref:TNF receptor-associated factor 2-like n=1 Tax=Ptychodera flava TaxID=63121 RepID=UPI00396A6510